jgi:hypothetical protein
MDADDTLNVFEQRPVWERLAINVAICFQLTEAADEASILKTLQGALDHLAGNFSWVAGRTVTEGASPAEGKTEVVKIVPRSDNLEISVRDHRGEASVSSAQSLKEAGYAVAMLDESVFAPRPAFVMVPAKEKPVLLIQANLVSGGLVLVFSGCHAAMDMPGLCQIMHWFCKACHNEAFTPQELKAGNMNRRDMIPLLDSTYEQGEELADLIPPTPTAGLRFPRVPCTWATFQIPSIAVNEIKANASATRTSAYVSTDDSLSAFLWQSVARSRVQRLDPATVSTTCRAIDVRRTLGIPANYPGLVQNNLFHRYSLSELCELPLGVVASKFRDTLTRPSPSLNFYTRALATALSRSVDKSAFRVTAHMDLSSDLLITSSIPSSAYHLDFAMGLGLPEAVRITPQRTFEGMAYMLPKTLAGDVTVVLCLRDEDIAALIADGNFGRYAQHMG